MINLGKKLVKYRIPILVLSILLLIPSIFGIINTRVNYDILYYLPDDIETMIGQDILKEDFGTGAFSMFMVEGMEAKGVAKIKGKIEKVEHVSSVIWYDSLMDISVPIEILPEKFYKAFNSDNSTIMAIFFDDTVSADVTMNAIEEIRSLAGKQCFLSGMSAMVTDTKNLSDQETPIYVMIAVVLSCIVLAIAMDSFLIPFIFMLSIGIAIIYNLGTNYFLGEISYITKALSAILQLGVTMDYSIFLLHSYEEQKKRYNGDKDRAMAHAISNTITSVMGSSLTTIAGFVALCFMSFTLGLDLGVVMTKGVIFGVICCITILPSMILIFDKGIDKTTHKSFIPDISGISKFVTKHHFIFILVFVALLIPAVYGYTNTDVYYNLDETLPKDLDSVIANTKLKDEFDMNSTHMLLVDANLPTKDVQNMISEMNEIKGVKYSIGLASIVGASIPMEMLPESIVNVLKSKDYQLILISSQYKVATDEVNKQIDELNAIIKNYDKKGMLIGEAPCTKDLIRITDKDFKVVSILSIGAIFLIIAVVFKSISLPFILVSVIEFAIFINMGIPYYTKTAIPFVASIVIGTIQLGATVDYAILMTTRYKKERRVKNKHESIQIALDTSMKSIIVSALGFFAATFGVGLYSNIDMISSLCTLMARGAIISMLVVIFILPSMFMVFDKIICSTTIGLNNKNNKTPSESISEINQ